MASKKQTRKKQIAEDTADDQFLVEANKMADWTQKNLKMLVGAVFGLAVIIAGVLFAQSASERSRSAATELFSEAVSEYRDVTDLQKTLTSTQPESLIEDAKKAMPGFEKVIAGGEGGANLARLYAADLERRAGAHDKAEALYKAYLADSDSTDIVRFIALEGAGYAAEEQKNLDDALGYFEKLTQLPKDFYKDYGLKHMARIYELKKDSSKALETYKMLVEQVPDSKLKEFADERIAALE